KPEYLYINPQYKDRIEKRLGKKLEEIKVEEVEDKELIILLAGIRQLLILRGFEYVKYNIHSANQGFSAVGCEIKFIENKELGLNEQIFGDNACAHFENTQSFAQKYLLEISTNRAFCRTVRGYLNLGIISREELQGNDYQNNNSEPQQNSINPIEILTNLMKEKQKSFLDLKNKLIKEGNEQAKDYTEIKDIPLPLIFKMIEKLKKVKDNK
ncbi:MAG: hypothetical protein AABY22_20160, partial [Nanoarchaeota archaeon]